MNWELMCKDLERNPCPHDRWVPRPYNARHVAGLEGMSAAKEAQLAKRSDKTPEQCAALARAGKEAKRLSAQLDSKSAAKRLVTNSGGILGLAV